MVSIPAMFARRWILILGLLTLCLIPDRATWAARSGSVIVGAFYSTTKANFDNWPKTNYQPPPRVGAFLPGVSAVAFFFRYAGALANHTQFQVVIRTSAGAAVAADPAFTVPTVGSVEMVDVVGPGQGTFPAGSYSADLLVDGTAAAHALFMVGAAPIPGAPLGPIFPSFYASTTAAQASWATFKYLPPAPISTFFAGTSEIALYYEYMGATAGVTRVEVEIHARNGALVAKATPQTLTQYGGARFLIIQAPGRRPFANGAYQAEILMGATVAATADFSVGRPPAAAYLFFYTAAASDATAWVEHKYAPLPQTTSFPANTTTIVAFFAFARVAADGDFYQVIIRDQAGKAVISNPAGYFPTNSGEQSLLETLKTPFPSGAYAADLYIDSQLAATIRFIVG
ncbi:MAG TPA: hypothetical protein VNL71_07455 [Chloroflexota bacterium]|nr:hypothetical protein [Chloroflexota bacterium]